MLGGKCVGPGPDVWTLSLIPFPQDLFLIVPLQPPGSSLCPDARGHASEHSSDPQPIHPSQADSHVAAAILGVWERWMCVTGRYVGTGSFPQPGV